MEPCEKRWDGARQRDTPAEAHGSTKERMAVQRGTWQHVRGGGLTQQTPMGEEPARS